MTSNSASRGPIRVMIVDDSPIARRLMEVVLGRSNDVEIVALVSDGLEVQAKLAEQPVDVLILDLEMPEVDGIEVLKMLAKRRLRLGVIVYSGAPPAVVDQAQQATEGRVPLRFVPKGRGVGGGVEGLDRSLVPLVLEVGEAVRRGDARELSPAPKKALAEPVAPPPPLPAKSSVGGPIAKPIRSPGQAPRVGVVVIGASTGGPDALKVFLESLPADIGVPLALVQHMPAGFTAQLAARLDSHCAVEVREAVHGERLVAGCVLVAPGGKHFEIHRSGPHLEARLTEAPPENSCRPAVDVLFRTAAEAMPRNLLGVVLTGMGQDGLVGAQAIRKTGGSVVVQDEATSVVWGMPGAIAKADEADKVLPLTEIAQAVTARVRRSPERTAGGQG